MVYTTRTPHARIGITGNFFACQGSLLGAPHGTKIGGSMEMVAKISRRKFVQAAAGLPAACVAGMMSFADNRVSPFADAVAAWHMSDKGDQTAAGARIEIHGEVKLGVPLQGAELDASLSRGGDGKVAEFRGGYLSLGQGGAAPDLTG